MAYTHPWDVTPEEAIAIQRDLRPHLDEGEPVALDQVRTVAGVDASYRDGGRAAVVHFTYPNLDVIERVAAYRASVFPYVPGLLSFREGPVVADAVALLARRPDVLIFDGQGIAHPRRLGLAAHMGLYLDLPSIGCAKSRLTGKHEEPGPEPGDTTPLIDRHEVIGAVLRSKRRTKPLYISVGYRVTLDDAVALVVSCLRGYRLPEPTRAAHNFAEGAKQLVGPERLAVRQPGPACASGNLTAPAR